MVAKEEGLTHKEYYAYAANQLQREEGLINNRLSWMLTFEGFLFAGVGLVSASASVDDDIQRSFNYIVPALGLLVALLTMAGINAAYVSSKNIRSCWESVAGNNIDMFPPAYGTPKADRRGRYTGYGVPVVMAAAWITVLFRAVICDCYLTNRLPRPPLLLPDTEDLGWPDDPLIRSSCITGALDEASTRSLPVRYSITTCLHRQ